MTAWTDIFLITIFSFTKNNKLIIATNVTGDSNIDCKKTNIFKTLAITNLQMTDKFSANILLTLVLLKVILELLWFYLLFTMNFYK